MPTSFVEESKILHLFAFKKNEDINLTKAMHIGMNLEHLALTEKKLTELKA